MITVSFFNTKVEKSKVQQAMERSKVDSVAATSFSCHVVAIPFPGRGHINPMINLCKHMLTQKPEITFTFVVTEEWLSLLSSYEKPPNIHFHTIPNVIPSEFVRAKDHPQFLEAVATEMEAPFDQLLDGLELRVDVIIYDTYLAWVLRVGNRRNIPVASLWTMSPTVFSIFYHFDLLQQNGHFPIQLSERGEEIVDYIPGVPPTRLLNFPAMFGGKGREKLHLALEAVSMVSKAQYHLFTCSYELEARVIDALKLKFPFPVYALGPSIPYLELKDSSSSCSATSDRSDIAYLQWLNSQPKDSVLYVSMGSFLSISRAQMEEIAAGIFNSGVRFLWVSRGETALFKDGYGSLGLVVPWCDQLRVLNHPSVGGFWTHCGWNSTMEAVFSGVPMLVSPISWDQIPNSKNIVEHWNVGWRVKRFDDENLVTREVIAKLVQNFMDPRSSEVQTMRNEVKALKEVCQAAVVRDGSSHTNLGFFIRDIISQGQAK